MWFLNFILFILVWLILRFVYDNLSLSATMRKAGGIPVMFADLVDVCLSCDGATIIQETPTFLSVGGKFIQDGITLNYAFWIQYTHGKKLIIKYVLKAPRIPQKVVKEWIFHSEMPQSKMIQAMMPFLDELMPSTSTSMNLEDTEWICNRYKELISRLKMEGTENRNLYTITVMCNCEDCYEFYLDMKYGHYKYTITNWLGKLRVSLDSQNYIKGKWEFPLDMNQTAIADKIEADINAMVMKNNNFDFYG